MKIGGFLEKNVSPFPLRLNLRSVKHLELILKGYTEKKARYYIDKKNNQVIEIKFCQQGQDGKTKERTVYNPHHGYKKLLKIINREILQKRSTPANGVLGGISGKTIDDMARVHCGREALFVVDFENFFPNIKSGMVFNLFRKAGCSSEVNEILTDLVTYKGSLPLGFPTSTMLANLIAHDVDVEHLRIAKEYKLMRTRWVDDIVFSGRKIDIKNASRFIIGSIHPFGFKVNQKKTKFMPRDGKEKPIVTGLEVSRKSPHTAPFRIHKIERLLNICETDGPLFAQQTYDSENGDKIKKLRSSLLGQINFVEKYDKEIGLGLKRRLDAIAWEISPVK